MLFRSFQVLMMAFIYFRFFKSKTVELTTKNNLSYLFGITGMFYLSLLIFIRLFSPFDPFDYRILSPFTLCIYITIMLYLINNDHTLYIKGAYIYIVLLFYVSLIFNLPKAYLITYFQNILQQIFY